MFTNIMVPVDLAAEDSWTHAILVACDLAEHYRAKITLVSVNGGLQNALSHSNEEHGRRLDICARNIASKYHVDVASLNYTVSDPAAEVDGKLLDAIQDLHADLVVMASHQPGWVEHFRNSHGGRMASHAPISVFIVRDPMVRV